MSETTADEIDMVMAIAADPEVWDATDNGWLHATTDHRRCARGAGYGPSGP